MSANKAVVGVFKYLDDLVHAINQAKADSLDYRVYSPVPHHAIEEATSPGRSNVRVFTSIGAVVGCIAGFALAILCSMDYPLRVSAKDVVSVPGFVVIGYECTILFGALATLIGLFHFCRLPDILRKVGYDPRFSDDKFGIVVAVEGRRVDEVSAKLKSCGAEEIDVREAL